MRMVRADMLPFPACLENSNFKSKRIRTLLNHVDLEAYPETKACAALIRAGLCVLLECAQTFFVLPYKACRPLTCTRACLEGLIAPARSDVTTDQHTC